MKIKELESKNERILAYREEEWGMKSNYLD
jgi:hypothetical protein